MARHTDHKTMQAWAERKAEAARAELFAMQAQSIPSGEWRKVQAKMRGIETLRKEVRKFEQLAATYAAGRTPRDNTHAGCGSWGHRV